MEAVNVERNEHGFWNHPAARTIPANLSQKETVSWFAERGFGFEVVLMDDQRPDLSQLFASCAEGSQSCVSQWEPECQRENSFLFGIYDTEDGVTATFVYPFSTPEQVLRDAWVAEYAMHLIRQCHFDLKTAISMGKSALKTDDFDTLSRSPSEAVDDEIAAMRDCC
ncbi:hypothetical protein [Vibrio anguillarum]|uniref:Uncharacterized protein n=1 Tax=Vibrio anguillarum TaxID=55601 RepID=A0A7U6FRZ7_VIBAN|nr:hypothetical protein [Vibrio anguillarum]AZS26231.1 hypothetical protein DYL72_15090 [Vibrio anguillarum]AZS26384.1 hypothetical protein DYL72_15890 [Vibrio anguillarum]MBF4374511.1 hypothetical protein [Vibrio anguillarum]